MTPPPERLGKPDGVIAKDGKEVGWFWENPATKGMTNEDRERYWKLRDEARK